MAKLIVCNCQSWVILMTYLWRWLTYSCRWSTLNQTLIKTRAALIDYKHARDARGSICTRAFIKKNAKARSVHGQKKRWGHSAAQENGLSKTSIKKCRLKVDKKKMYSLFLILTRHTHKYVTVQCKTIRLLQLKAKPSSDLCITPTKLSILTPLLLNILKLAVARKTSNRTVI